MNIEELKDKHELIAFDLNHAKLSIEFAISVLEEVYSGQEEYSITFNNKIQELKQWLNENN